MTFGVETFLLFLISKLASCFALFICYVDVLWEPFALTMLLHAKIWQYAKILWQCAVYAILWCVCVRPLTHCVVCGRACRGVAPLVGGHLSDSKVY